MGLYEVPLPLLGFGMGTMLANFHMCGIMCGIMCGMLYLSAISMMFLQILLVVCMLVGMVV